MAQDTLLDDGAPEGADLPTGDEVVEQEPAPEVPAEGEGEGEEEGDGEVEAADPAGAGEAQRGGRPSEPWRLTRKLQKENEHLTGRLAEFENRFREFDELKARLAQPSQQAQPQAQAPAQAPQFQPVPQYTQDQLGQLAQEDPVEYNRVISVMAYNAAVASQQQNQVVQAQMEVNSQINEFRSRTPDYNMAVQHLEARERARLVATGINGQDVEDMLRFRASQLIQLAQRTGRNVGQLAYEVALADGYVSAAQTAVALAAPARPVVRPEEKVKASQARTRQAAGSLSNVGGSASGKVNVPQSKDELLNLSEKELDRLDSEAPGWEKRFFTTEV